MCVCVCVFISNTIHYVSAIMSDISIEILEISSHYFKLILLTEFRLWKKKWNRYLSLRALKAITFLYQWNSKLEIIEWCLKYKVKVKPDHQYSKSLGHRKLFLVEFLYLWNQVNLIEDQVSECQFSTFLSILANFRNNVSW